MIKKYDVYIGKLGRNPFIRCENHSSVDGSPLWSSPKSSRVMCGEHWANCCLYCGNWSDEDKLMDVYNLRPKHIKPSNTALLAKYMLTKSMEV